MELCKKRRQAYLQHGWKEIEHPRDKRGRFISKEDWDADVEQRVMEAHYEKEAAKRKQLANVGKVGEYTYTELTEAEKQKRIQEVKDRDMEKWLEEDAELEQKQRAEAAEGIAKGTTEIFKGVSTASNQLANMMPTGGGKTVHPDYSEISDAELAKRLNRINLENNYARATGEAKYMKTGSEKAREILQTIGAVAGIAAILGGIAVNISTIRSNKKKS